jgi:hypothetical protein
MGYLLENTYANFSYTHMIPSITDSNSSTIFPLTNELIIFLFALNIISCSLVSVCFSGDRFPQTTFPTHFCHLTSGYTCRRKREARVPFLPQL